MANVGRGWRRRERWTGEISIGKAVVRRINVTKAGRPGAWMCGTGEYAARRFAGEARKQRKTERYKGSVVPLVPGQLFEMVSGACLVCRGVVESKPLAKVIEISVLGTSIRRFCAAHLRSGLSGLR